VTQPRQDGDAESSWQQPPFVPEQESAQPATGEVVVPGQFVGQGLVPAEERRPPSVLESTLNVVNGVLWPVLIGLVFFGIGNWVLNIFVAIAASSLLGGIATELKRRRKYLPPADRKYLPPAEGDLR
jgi:hypothetical protein